MHYLFPIGIEVDHFCSILKQMVSYVPGFGKILLPERVDDSNAGFAVQLEEIAISWLWVVHGDEDFLDRDHFLSAE